MTIRARLLLLVLSVLVPATVAALWLIAQAYLAEQQAHQRTLRDSTRALAMVVGRELNQRAAIARVLSLSSTVDDGPSTSPERLQQFQRLARRAMTGLDGWVELSAATGLLLSTRSVEPSGPQRAAAPLADSPVIGPLAAGPGGALHATIVYPVQRDGRTLLNVTITLLPQELQKIIEGQRLPPDWVAAVLDGSGTVVARHPGGTAYAGRLATPDIQRRLAAGGESAFESTSLDGVPVTGYVSSSPQGWSYLTAMPGPQRAGQVPRAVLEVAALCLLMLGLTVAGALWVARRIADPVHSLKQAAVDMKAGREVALRSTGIVECDEVAAALADASQSLRRGQSRLESQVAEAVSRTREAEQRVSQSQRVEALGRLTGGVAHDFNNLLGVISNSAHLIERQAAGRPELQLPAAAMLRAVNVGSRLTQHLMRFAGQQPVQPRPLDLARYLPETRDLLVAVLGKRVELSVDVEHGTHPVTVDARELELALINLALNARDALGPGGHLWLRARNANADDCEGLPPASYVLLTVTDDGCGMDDDVARRVFEPFFTTKPLGQGTGLGLSQVHGFCVQAGGMARLASTPGLGTTVSLLLAGLHEPAAETAPAAVQALPPMNNLRVLLVEDNEALGDVTAALLNGLGCRVQLSTGPKEALELLGSGAAFDLVLSDISMPGPMDGLELARALRQRWPALPVVLITGYSRSRAAEGEFVVLAKPCTPQVLLAGLQAALQGKASLDR